MTDDPGIKAWSKNILSEYGAPDLLINSAAVPHQRLPLWEISTEEFDRVIDVNIKRVAKIIRHFVPAMVAQQRGIIVNFSAGWGSYTAAKGAPYCASKWAIERLTGALAQELPSGMAAVSLWAGGNHSYRHSRIYLWARKSGQLYLCPRLGLNHRSFLAANWTEG